MMVNFSDVWSFDSTSALSARTDAIMSALLASMTSGTSPYTRLVNSSSLEL